ncbi:FolC bifunctional protein [Rostrohypoxylon terebratum]|nr:FolC bifunctional protein [Rostrohypoxylon terebratum]
MAYAFSTAIRNIRAASLYLYRTPLNPKNEDLLKTFGGILVRHSSTTMAARTYESALRHLDSIQSNRAVTSLFTPPAPFPGQPKPTSQDLNAQAIPEILAWAERAGLSQQVLGKMQYIHVAGTKGKGSVCAYLTSILTTPHPNPNTTGSSSSSGTAFAAGKVGTYTSPHLLSVRERIQLDGAPIPPSLFAQYFFEVWDALTAAARAEALSLSRSCGGQVSEEEIAGPRSKPFYFRFLTLLALHAFVREGVTTAVVECGIGGEYDSTNILPKGAVTAAVVAQLGVDHVGMLGGTVPEIAWNKAGVMKEGVKCFTRKLEGGDGEATMKVLRERAAEKNAVLVEIEDREVEEWGGVRGEGVGSLEGEFQKYNQALAVMAAGEHLRLLEGKTDTQSSETKLSILGERFSDGLRQARLRGRCETRQEGNFSWFIDGAHTAESLEEAAKWFAAKQKALPSDAEVVLLFNQQERDVARLLSGLLEGIKRVLGESTIFDHAIFTRNDIQPRTQNEPERDLSVQQAAQDAMQKLCPKTKSAIVDNVGEAVSMIKELQNDEGKIAILATGSLHLVGGLLRTLEPEAGQ